MCRTPSTCDPAGRRTGRRTGRRARWERRSGGRRRSPKALPWDSRRPGGFLGTPAPGRDGEALGRAVASAILPQHRGRPQAVAGDSWGDGGVWGARRTRRGAGLSAWLYFVLAHLIADFVLQPYELVELKRRPVGLVIHTAIHAAVTAVLVAPFVPAWPLLLPPLAVAHYLIDWWKVTASPARGPASLGFFLADQALHLAVLGLAVVAAGLSLRQEITYRSVAATGVLYYGVPYVAATFAGAVATFQVAAAFATRAEPVQWLLPRLRVEGIVARGLALSLVLFAAPLLWPLGAAPFVVRAVADRAEPGSWLEAAVGYGLVLGLGVLFR
ncbi:MAG: DUF3307 domain-containing protein [Firmicutes bacterium]|nr:DUF3307 domain-containing protein [Bacillota bacterium]